MFVFVYGFNIYFDVINFLSDVDVFLVVLKGFGYLVCCIFVEGGVVFFLFVIY